MKCVQCGTKNDNQSKFCKQCGVELSVPETPAPVLVSELFGKEVDVLFFKDSFTGKISGLVNPSEEQVARYKDGVRQRVTIEHPTTVALDENISTLLTFIRQSKEYLGEEFHETYYRNVNVSDLKKEYLHLFDRILKVKSKRQEAAPPPAKPEKK